LSGPNKLFFGSTTERLLRSTPVPVLAVPAHLHGGTKRGGLPGSWPGRTALVPVDLADEARGLLRAGTTVARQLGMHPLVVHVVAPAKVPSWLALSGPRYERERLLDARARLKALCAEAGDHAPCRVLTGEPWKQIAALVVDSNIDLVVVGLKPRKGLFGPRQGSITYRILTAGVAPVLALPPGALKR
jgi:nucleotide-binding universal stress UspA family protein